MAKKRKIPTRKHHGIRDPLKNLEDREKKLAKVTNHPPTQADEQRLSYKFKQFKQIADAAKSGKKLKRQTIGVEDKPKQSTKKQTPTGNKHRNIKQFAEETDEDYLKRVNRITTTSLREAQYEVKYGVNVIRNSKTGEITIEKRPKNEIDELLKRKQTEQRIAKNGRRNRKDKQLPDKANAMDAKTKTELIKRAFKEADEDIKLEREKNAPPTEYKRDVFKFGEIVHAPPSITALPRKATKNETVPRPGRKANLLLKSMMDVTKPAESTQAISTTDAGRNKKLSSSTNGVIKKVQLKGKRKELPAATRAMLDGERNKMVDLYRQLKKSREANRSMQ